jgi:hypothetical protein
MKVEEDVQGSKEKEEQEEREDQQERKQERKKATVEVPNHGAIWRKCGIHFSVVAEGAPDKFEVGLHKGFFREAVFEFAVCLLIGSFGCIRGRQYCPLD